MGRDRCYQRLPHSHPSHRQPEVKEELGITHNAWPDRLPRSPQHSILSLAPLGHRDSKLNQTVALARLDEQMGMR